MCFVPQWCFTLRASDMIVSCSRRVRQVRCLSQGERQTAPSAKISYISCFNQCFWVQRTFNEESVTVHPPAHFHLSVIKTPDIWFSLIHRFPPVPYLTTVCVCWYWSDWQHHKGPFVSSLNWTVGISAVASDCSQVKNTHTAGSREKTHTAGSRWKTHTAGVWPFSGLL